MTQRYQTYTKLFLGLALGIALLFSHLTYYSTEAQIVLLVIWGILLVVWLPQLRAPSAVPIGQTPLDLAFFLILLALLFSFRSLNPGLSLRIAGGWSLAICGYFITSLFLQRQLITTRWIISVIVGILLIFVVAIYIEVGQIWWEWRQSEGIIPFRIGLVHGLTESRNILALLIAWFGLICAGNLWDKEQIRGLFLVGALLIVPAIYWIDSLGGYVSLAAGLAVLFLGHTSFYWLQLWHKVSRSGQKIILGASVLGGIGIAAVAIWFLLNDVGLGDRTTYWQAALDTWQNNRATGTGLGTFITTFLTHPTFGFHERLFFHAHSFWFGMLAEMGLVGFVANLILWVYLAWQGLQQYKLLTTPRNLVLLACLAAFFMHTLVEMPRYRTWLIVYIFMAALMFELRSDQKQALPSWHPQRWSHLLSRYMWPMIGLLVFIGMWHNLRIHQQYETGLALAEDDNWEAAATQFAKAHEQAWLTDTAVLNALAYSQARVDLANGNSPQTDYYEALIQLEPGWAVNHLHLGLLYQAQNDAESPDNAERAFSEATRLGRTIHYTWLAKIEYYEETGKADKAAQAYKELYDLNTTWHVAPYWENIDADIDVLTCIAPSCNIPTVTKLEAGWDLWGQGDLEQATEIFETLANNNQNTTDIGLATGLYLVNSDLAADTTADQIFQISDSRRSNLFYQNVIDLFILDGLDSSLLKERLNFVLNHTAQGYAHKELGQAPGQYVRLGFLRNELPYELLPTVQCFSFNDRLAWQMDLLETWYTNNGRNDLADVVRQASDGTNGRGVRPCTQAIP